MEDYRKSLDDFCGLLNNHGVAYLVVGAVAVNYHGFQRSTGDIDIWYNPTTDNYNKLLNAIKAFGFEISELIPEAYKDSKGIIRLPVEGYTIELISIIDVDFTFDEAYQRSETFRVINQNGRIISYKDLIANKIQSHRPKDLEDIKQLEIRKEELKKRKKGS